MSFLDRQVLQLILLIVVSGVISVASVFVVVVATRFLPGDELRPIVVLPILLVVGLIALVAALVILVGAFALFGQLDKESGPFGLPEGTLQAVVAMMIIMIFAITSLYLNGSFQAEVFKSTGLSEKQLDAIPQEEIRSITAHAATPDDPNTAADESSPATYDVERAPRNAAGEDFGMQLLTTLSTLVVAIVGFYFGAKSVETGVRATGAPPGAGAPNGGAGALVQPGSPGGAGVATPAPPTPLPPADAP